MVNKKANNLPKKDLNATLRKMYYFTKPDESIVPSVMELIKRAIKRLDEMGIHQWDSVYPDTKTIMADIEKGTLHALMKEDKLAGILVLSEYQDPEYNDIQWEVPDTRPLILHRLCLDPAYQGKGISKLMMNHVEEFAHENRYRSIRLDAFAENPISVKLYQSLGFTIRGIVHFRKGQFYCFKKM